MKRMDMCGRLPPLRSEVITVRLETPGDVHRVLVNILPPQISVVFDSRGLGYPWDRESGTRHDERQVAKVFLDINYTRAKGRPEVQDVAG